MTTRATSKVPTEKRRTCTRCGRVGHLATKRDGSPNCDAPPHRHDKVGIEIEGFWIDLATAQSRAQDLTGRRGVNDGSVSGGGDCDCDDDEGCACGSDPQGRGWEFQTQAGTLGEALRQLTALYPDRTNASCGMHVHVSFLNTADVTMLASQAFFDYFQAEWRAWGTRMNIRAGSQFWERLEGRNTYCRPSTIADWQHHNARGIAPINASQDRYRQLNFQAWSEHQTIECRLLPMFQSAALAVSAVETLVEMIERYLAREDLIDRALECDDLNAAPQMIDRGEIDGDADLILPATMAITRELASSEIEIGYPEDATPGTEVVPAYRAALRLEERASAAIRGTGLIRTF